MNRQGYALITTITWYKYQLYIFYPKCAWLQLKHIGFIQLRKKYNFPSPPTFEIFGNFIEYFHPFWDTLPKKGICKTNKTFDYVNI